MAKQHSHVTEFASFTQKRLGDQPVSFPLEETAGSIIRLQVYATLVRQQGILDTKYFPTAQAAEVALVNGHQRLAKSNAGQVADVLCPAVIRALSAVEAFSRMFESFATPLASLLGSGKAEDKAEALALINALYEEATTHERNAQNLNAQFVALLTKITANKTSFAADAKKLADALSTDSGKLAKINQEIRDISSGIDSQIASIAASIIGLAAGTVMLLVGGLVTVATAGLASALVVSGVIAVAAGSGGVIAASVLLAESNKKLAKLYQDAAACNQLVAASTAMSQQVASFADAVTSMETEALAMHKEWESVALGIADLREALRESRSPADIERLKSDLRAALADWRGVATQAKVMAGKLTGLTIKEVDDILAIPVPSVA